MNVKIIYEFSYYLFRTIVITLKNIINFFLYKNHIKLYTKINYLQRINKFKINNISNKKVITLKEVN